MSEWISVEDRLPNALDVVLVVNDIGGMSVVQFYPNFNIPDSFDGEEATHWMPLPEPPK